MSEISVQAFLTHAQGSLGLEILSGTAGLGRVLRAVRIQKPGLALAGFTEFVHPDRVQILGQTELSYLDHLDAPVRARAVDNLLSKNVACIVVTRGLTAPVELTAACERTGTPLLRTQLRSSETIRKVLNYLDDLLTARSSVHGVLVDVDGVGVLLTGASGVGKSECALDLVLRGHRLVADDVVEVRRRGEDLVGQAAELIRNLIEIRGLGILNIAELYGVAATRDHKRIELHIELEEWQRSHPYDRTGLDERRYEVLGVSLQSLLVPVRPGRDIAAIVEVAARNFLLRLRGHHAAADLKHRIDVEMDRADRRSLEMIEESVDIPPLPNLRAAANLSGEGLDHIEDEVE